jgi:hypothetical protein
MNILTDHIKQTVRTIDAFLGNYSLGTLIMENNTVSLETENDEILLDDSYIIEVFDGKKYHPITYSDAVSTISNDGWPLYVGLEARVKKGVVK